MAIKSKPVDTFLPDFCTRESLLVVIVIAELLTLVLTMTRNGTFNPCSVTLPSCRYLFYGLP